MTKQEFTGKSLDDALEAAAKTMGVDRTSVNYNVLPASSTGGILSKLFSRSVRIEAWTDNAETLANAAREAVRQVMEKPSQQQNNQRQSGKARDHSQQPQPQQQSQQPRRESSQEQPRAKERQPERERPASRERNPQRERPAARERHRDIQERNEIRQPRNDSQRVIIPLDDPAIGELFSEYKGVFLKTFAVPSENCVQDTDPNGNWTVEVKDDFIEEMLARSDKLAMAFEHVFKRVAQKKVGDVEGRIYLTSGRAAEMRKEGLELFAKELAEKVMQTGRSITVSSKTSQERRVIHLTLDGTQGISTRSVGSGDRRRLIVYPTGANQQRNKDNSNENSARSRQSPNQGQAQPRGDGQRRGGKRRANRGQRRPESETNATPSQSSEQSTQDSSDNQ
jgi:spoIIIJ-associated protein